ncbi:hypothetical protein [Paraburkholderia aspalathi]|uniref:hypothetical protein n=1 Tax=Paraburkholderia aspalathi TaxID=1324617 RepID=UPI0038B7DDBB
MKLPTSQTEAPHLGRSVLIAPNRHVNLAQAGHPLVTIVPRTRLGALALNLVVQSSVATIQIIATSTYVNSLTALAPPPTEFSVPPPGTTISVESLQDAWDQFVIDLASLQGNAAEWITTSNSTGGASIVSTLTTVAGMIGSLNSAVQAEFIVLQNLPPSTTAWKNAFSTVTNLISAELQPVQGLQTSITLLSNDLNLAAETLMSAANTGVLEQLQAAYINELGALNADIQKCNDEISADNKKIIALGASEGVSGFVGISGILNIWNPLGWLAIGAGVAGAYFAAEEIETLEGQIGLLTGLAKTYSDQLTPDQQASTAVTSFSASAQAAASMNSASQQELTTLIQLCSAMGTDLNEALTDLSDDEIAASLAEWNAVVSEAAFLGAITAYIWPSWLNLANPTSLTAAGSNAWVVSNSGTVFSWTSGSTAWLTLPSYTLSMVSAGSVIAGIDGAPNNAAVLDPNSYGQSFYVKLFNAGQNAWTTVSAFPAAQVTTDGTSLWAINQITNDRQVYAYSGSGTNWTQLPALPINPTTQKPDAPMDIAAVNGTVVAIANNTLSLWSYSGSNWNQITDSTYGSITANGGLIGLIDTSSNAWVLDIGNKNALTAMMTSVNTLAQAPNGDQYATDNNLNLWYVAFPQNGGSPVCTQVMSNVTGVTVSDGGTVYATDNNGVLWTLVDAGNNAWQQLPVFPGLST